MFGMAHEINNNAWVPYLFVLLVIVGAVVSAPCGASKMYVLMLNLQENIFSFPRRECSQYS